MRLEVTFKYSSTTKPTAHVSAYDLNTGDDATLFANIVFQMGNMFNVVNNQKKETKDDTAKHNT